VDIGGGSTELIVGRAGGIEVVSLDLGCVRLTERYLRHDPPTARELADATSAVDTALDGAARDVPSLARLAPRSRLIGLAGTVSTLASLALGLGDYDRVKLHGAILTRASVDHWYETLAAETARARLAHPGMVLGRQDVIVGGALVLRQVMQRSGLERCIHSESDILDGLVSELLADHVTG